MLNPLPLLPFLLSSGERSC